MRLPRHLLATPTKSNGKDGRTVPSAVMFVERTRGDDINKNVNETNLEDGIQSIIRFNGPKPQGDNDDTKEERSLAAWVGEAAIRQRYNLQEAEDEKKIPASTATTATLVRSVKRILGKRFDELSPDLVRSLPLELIQGADEACDDFVRVPGEEDQNFDSSDDDDLNKYVRVRVVTYRDQSSETLNASDDGDDTKSSSLSVSPVQILAVILQSIRLAANEYLKQPSVRRKRMEVPGGKGMFFSTTEVKNVVVGVPAHFSSTQRQLVQRACRMAGFQGQISTLMESTAAAMAYGLSFNAPVAESTDMDGNENGSSNHQTILVVDMGGGTTDITIASRESVNDRNHREASSSSTGYTVVVTEGDAQLGGDDMDQAMLEYVVGEIQNATKKNVEKILSISDRRSLLRSCRTAKEALCDDEAKLSQVEVDYQNRKVVITQADFQSIISPWIERARALVQTAVRRFQGTPISDDEDHTHKTISEVVLVGGATRVPAVRTMLQDVFPKVELCTSLDPMGSVAQGLAIHAAFLSKDVPIHLLKSALMLDSIPHAIGVQVGGRNEDVSIVDRRKNFIPILKRNARLPAFGSAKFVLADVRQPGVTIRAVEQIGEKEEEYALEPMSKEDFTFMLRRLPEEELQELSERTIEVGMKVDTDGKFIVSIFDELDPEQVRKKERFLRLKDNKEGDADAVFGELSYMTELVMAETEFTTEQWLLLAGTIGMFIFYIAIKIAFAEPPNGEDGARIL